jgi:hypothetical protein
MTNCFGVQAQIRHATRTTTPQKGTVEAAARRGDTASGLPTPPCRLSVTPPVTHSACMRGDDGGGGSRSWASRRRGGLFELAACPDLPSTAEVAKRCYWNAVAQRPLLPRLHRSLRCRRRRGGGGSGSTPRGSAGTTSARKTDRFIWETDRCTLCCMGIERTPGECLKAGSVLAAGWVSSAGPFGRITVTSGG